MQCIYDHVYSPPHIHPSRVRIPKPSCGCGGIAVQRRPPEELTNKATARLTS